MITTVAFNLVDYVRTKWFEIVEDEESRSHVDQQVNEYSEYVYDKTKPIIKGIERKARKVQRRASNSLWSFYHPDEPLIEDDKSIRKSKP